MHTDRVIFSQLMDVISKYKFRNIVARHKGDYCVQKLACLLWHSLSNIDVSAIVHLRSAHSSLTWWVIAQACYHLHNSM